MFEKLTMYLPMLEKETEFGSIVGTDPGYVTLGPIEERLYEAVYDVYSERRGIYRKKNMWDYLSENGIEWDFEPMINADVSKMDGFAVLSLLLAAHQAERWYEGALLEFYNKGCIVKWLSRLKEIDEENKGK